MLEFSAMVLFASSPYHLSTFIHCKHWVSTFIHWKQIIFLMRLLLLILTLFTILPTTAQTILGMYRIVNFTIRLEPDSTKVASQAQQ